MNRRFLTILLTVGLVMMSLWVSGSGMAMPAGPQERPLQATADVTGGLARYQTVASNEQAVPYPVFERGGSQPGLWASAPGASAVSVDILAPPAATPVKSITLSQVSANEWQGSWDWTSTTWSQIPGQVPVGEYTARFNITGGSPSTIDQKFYVIFDPPASWQATFVEHETGVWFGSAEWYASGVRQGGDRAITYDLHPDDNRVFGPAIQAANGETSYQTAATKVFNAEMLLFGYSLTNHCYDPLTGYPMPCDVLLMLSSFTEAQCADDANMLAAMLRAIGLAAHPSTGDADLCNMSWTFDTWTEVWLPDGAGGADWYVYHPHEGYGPLDRLTFGTTQGVALKSANDVIIMAGANWPSSYFEAADLALDLGFSYGANGAPLQNFDWQATWLENVSQEYWGMGHWTDTSEPGCPQCPNLTVGTDQQQYDAQSWGLVAQGQITNQTGQQVTEQLIVQILYDDPLSKQSPDMVVAQQQQEYTIPPYGSQDYGFEFEAGQIELQALQAGQDYQVQATFGPNCQNGNSFWLAPCLTWQLQMPQSVQQGQQFSAQLQLQNQCGQEVQNGQAHIELPGNLQTSDSQDQQVPPVSSGQSQTVTWNVQAQSPCDPCQVVVNVTSDNGGNFDVRQGVQVSASAPPPTNFVYLPIILRNY